MSVRSGPRSHARFVLQMASYCDVEAQGEEFFFFFFSLDAGALR